MELHLDAVERRVLGSLMEKDITTPEYYPLTLNALLAACNQKSSREPVMELEEAAVREALRLLEEKGLAGVARAEARVARFEHRMGEVLNLGRRESALLCTLLLRGAQTPGELRGRSERMHHLEDLDEVNLVLQKLIGHDPPLARLLPRQTGTKEARYADLFGGDDGLADGAQSIDRASTDSREERIAALEGEVAQLRAEIEALRREFSDFRGQFNS
ncbi:MAG: YceH family protein [Candidatus Korobacteraceae bacterium]